jgi:hypothetical protein
VSELLTKKICQECGVAPVGFKKSKYCDECAPVVWRRQCIEGAVRHAERLGGWSARHRHTRYGVSQEQYDEMVRRQRNCCGICGRKMTKPNIDHDHATGHVRGLLCWPCNTGIGKFAESVDRLHKAVGWLRRAQDV